MDDSSDEEYLRVPAENDQRLRELLREESEEDEFWGPEHEESDESDGSTSEGGISDASDGDDGTDTEDPEWSPVTRPVPVDHFDNTQCGPKHQLGPEATEVNYFNLYWPESLVETMVAETNR